MAAIVLPVVAAYAIPAGTAVWASVAITTAASAAGSYFDSQVLMPALFPTETPTQIGDRMSEFELQSAAEGSPIKRLYGSRVRAKGTILWMSEIREIKNDEEISGGGKGGSNSVDVTSYEYRCDIAIGFSERQVNSLLRVDGDGKKLWWGSNVCSVGPSTKIAATERKRVTWNVPALPILPPGHTYPPYAYAPVKTTTKTMRLVADADGPDLTAFKVGHDATVTGFAGGGNNVTGRVVKRKKKSNGKTVLELVNPTRVAEAAGASVSITQTVDKFSKWRCDGVTFYDGTQIAVDPLIDAAEGTANAPYFRGIAYFVIENLRMDSFGRRVPQLSVWAEADASITDGEIIAEELIDAGLSAGQVSAAACDTAVTGFIVSGPQNKLNALRPLLLAYDRIGQEIDGQLVFKPRADVAEITVAEGDLAAHEVGGDAPRKLQINDASGLVLPTEVNVEYIDKDDDEQLGSTKMRKLDGVAGGKGGVISANLPLVLTADEARVIAARLLWVPHTHRQNAQVQLPPSYLHVTENDVLVVTAHGREMKVLVRRIDRGSLSGMHVIEVSSAHVYLLGYYWACCAADDADQWAGGIVYASKDGTNYLTFEAVSAQAILGAALTALADGPVGYWDRESTVQVELHNGALSSKTEREVLDGANTAVLGQEVIAFQAATLVDDDTYELSVLLRGLRNTEAARGGHEIGDRFVLMTGVGVSFREMSQQDIAHERRYKAVATGGDIDDVDAVTFRPIGATLRPFSPCLIEGARDGSNNLTVTWVPRSREPMDEFSQLPIPAMGVSEDYEIDFYSGSTIVRTKTVTGGTRTTTYTAAEQTTDGLTPGDDVDLAVFQMSDVIGRGNPGEATV
jgi:hypothetical protein